MINNILMPYVHVQCKKCKKNNQTSVSDSDEKSQPSGQHIMPETRLTSFPALSVYPRIGISRFASETGDRFYLAVFIGTKPFVDFSGVRW